MTKTNQELARALLKKIHDLLDPKWQSIYTARNLERMIEEHYAEAFPRWIPCSERMPEYYEWVMVGGNGFIDFDYRHREGWASGKPITNWQPRPQPPEATT